MVRNAKLVGQSIIAYLQKKGYPEVSYILPDYATAMHIYQPWVWNPGFTHQRQAD